MNRPGEIWRRNTNLFRRARLERDLEKGMRLDKQFIETSISVEGSLESGPDFERNSSMTEFSVTVNGKAQRVHAEPDMPLLWVLRDLLQMTGTKFGCGVGVCGACTIHEGGEAVRACQLSIADANGKSFTTIEGLSASGEHPCQKAWIEEDVAQCGYCQPGMIMTAAALLKKHPNASDEEIDSALANSVCRCGTYLRMRRAIHRAAKEMAK
ncbi:MAG: (2Fe-2S)-binding protein [Candidatus Acidiferrales bacterium]